MADINTSANMSLPIPVTGVDSGPDYANNINACLTLVDGHDHSSGKGVPINPAGININSDLPFGGNNLTLARSLRLQPQSAPLALVTDLGCLYESGVDLYYNDGSGNQVRLTQSGAVAGTPGSIANLVSPASASYVSGSSTFVFQSAANTPANIDGASFLFRNLVANSKALTLAPPNAMGSDYSIVLPSLPASQKFVTLDASGNMSAPWSVDNSTLEISSNTLQVKDLGITAAKLAADSVTTVKILDANVTRPKLEAVGAQISASSGSFTTSSATFVDVTNLTVTITTSGRPVMLMLRPDGGAVGGNINTTASSSGQRLVFDRAGTNIFNYTSQSGQANFPVSSFNALDTAPAAGTYTYKVKAACPLGSSISVLNAVLVAYEL